MIEGVQEIAANLQVPRLPEIELFHGFDVGRVLTLAAEAGQIQWKRAVVVSQIDAGIRALQRRTDYAILLHRGVGEIEAAGIESTRRHRAPGDVGPQGIRIAVVIYVAPLQWKAALRDVYPIPLPASQHRIQWTAPVAAEPSSFPHRDLPDPAE